MKILSHRGICVKYQNTMVVKKNPSAHAIRTRRRRTGGVASQPTVGDIARIAGVSTATVSRALNRPETVSPQLRDRVGRVVKELGYLPSGAAKALASNRSFTIGAVVPTLNNAIFSACIAAFESRLSDAGYTLLITVSNYDHSHETQQVRRLLERGVDGMMVVGLDHADATYVTLERANAAYVTIWGYDENSPVPCVGFDNAAAAETVVDHLFALGHRRLAMVAGITRDNDRATARLAGVKRAMQRHNLTMDPGLFMEKPYTHQCGRDAFADLMSLSEPPTAIICGNDVLAMGVMFEANLRGIAIPGEVSITGYDNLPITRHLNPGLTTIDLPSEAIGHAAADVLIANQAEGHPIKSRLFDAPLLVRGTTGPCPGGRR